MAVVPPIPKASVNTAAAVKTGDNLNCRRAYRKLPGRLCMEHLSLLYALEPRQVPKAGNRRTSPAVRRALPQSAALLTIQEIVCHGAAIVRKMRFGGGAKQYPR